MRHVEAVGLTYWGGKKEKTATCNNHLSYSFKEEVERIDIIVLIDTNSIDL